MKLYYHDQCPFCLRALMVANYKNIDLQKIALQYDDEATCLKLVNAKQVPILEFDDGQAMAESLDIAYKLDEMGDPARIISARTENAQEVTNLYNQVQTALSCLIYPRNIKIGLPEFAEPSAVKYFQNKKEKLIHRSFEQALSETKDHTKSAEKMLNELSAKHLLPRADHLSWDDVAIFPQLRNLTIVKGLSFPNPVRDYIEKIAAMTGMHLYFDRAV